MAIYGTSKYGQSFYGSTVEDYPYVHPYLRVPGKVLWLLQVDWDGDGDFGSTYEPQTFVKLKFRRGIKKRIRTDGKGQEHPEQETFWIELIDTDARYDSFNESSPIYDYLGASGVAMRLLVTSTSAFANPEPVFVGTLSSVTYNSKVGRATLIGEGLARLLQIGDAEKLYSPRQFYPYDPCFVQDSSTPSPVNWWSGRTGGTYLRECARLVLEQAGWLFDMYSGANNYNTDYPDFFYLSNESAWNAIKDLADGFAARVFFLRDGRLFVMDRQDTAGYITGAAPLSGASEKFGIERPSPFEILRNMVEVQIRPHSVKPFRAVQPIEADYVKVWSNPGPITIPPTPEDPILMDIEFEFDGKPVQGPFAIEDTETKIVNIEPWIAWSNADGTGTNLKTALTAEFYITIASDLGENQQRGKLTFYNFSAGNAYFFDLNVYAIGIIETGLKGLVTKSDAASITLNKTRKLEINSRWIQRTAMGEAIAQAYVDALATRADASPTTLGYAWSGDALFANLQAYELGTFVEFGAKGGATALANFGLWGRRLIVGLEMEWLSPDGQDAFVKLTFEKNTPAQVQVSGTVTTAIGNPAIQITASHIVPDGINRVTVVKVACRAYQTVASITLGAQSFTYKGSAHHASGNYAHVEIWELAAPAVGTATLTVNLTGAEFAEVAAVNFVNARQVNPLGLFASDTDMGGSPATVNVAAERGDLVIDILAKEGGTLAADATQTSLWARSADGSWKASGSSKLGAATVAMSWTLTGANSWALAAVAVKSVSN